MFQTLQYKTDGFSKNCSIAKENTIAGYMIKSSLFGKVYDLNIHDDLYIIETSGWWSPEIKLIDRVTKNVLITARVHQSFNFINIKARAVSNTGNVYVYSENRLLNKYWKWSKDETTVVRSVENNYISNITGQIMVNQENHENELLSTLGIHIRFSVERHSIFTYLAIFSYLVFLFR